MLLKAVTPLIRVKSSFNSASSNPSYLQCTRRKSQVQFVSIVNHNEPKNMVIKHFYKINFFKQTDIEIIMSRKTDRDQSKRNPVQCNSKGR